MLMCPCRLLRIKETFNQEPVAIQTYEMAFYSEVSIWNMY